RDPDRLAPGPPEHLLRVRPHRVEVDERERRLHLLENLLVSRVRLVWVGHRIEPSPAGRTRKLGPVHLCLLLPVRERSTCRLIPAAGGIFFPSGEVAEWLKALAC